MKATVLIGLMLAALGAGWLAGCDNDVKFTRVVEGRTWGLQPDDSSWYNEHVLVKNMPEDEMEQCKIMINYFDSVGLSIDDLSQMPEIGYYCVYFYKSTPTTRKLFIEKKKISEGKDKACVPNEEYLGDIYAVRCKNDPAKWKIGFARNIEPTAGCDHTSLDIQDVYLQNDCDPAWYRANKDSALVKYYMGLGNE